ncbi:MAG: class I SAM-dependent methyltransferase [Nocardioidaceae bacterium]
MTDTLPLRRLSLGRRTHAPVAAGVARAIFSRAVRLVPVRVTWPDGRITGGAAADADAPDLEVIRSRAFFTRLGRDTKIGFGEAYVAGDWRAAAGTDLADLLTPFAARLTSLVPRPMQRVRALVDVRQPSQHENTLDGSRHNIAAHYDLSNDLFEQFLDPTMSYSAAWFDDDGSAGDPGDLEAAQLRKIDGILDFADVGAGTRLLEVGTGWGSLAVRAAQRGAQVTSVTISAEQLEFAQELVDIAGVGDRVDLRLEDYREVSGEYDAIVSVEMIEAVGEQYWPTYFKTLDRLLAPGGKVAIQSITMAHERMLATRHSFGWIQKYIFPGGLIPSLQAIDNTVGQHTGLRVTGRRDLGQHYARTLRQWRTRFLQNWPEIQTLGFDDPFRRMWEFYLAYCEAGFRADYLGVSQLQLTREPTWT